MAVSGPGLTVPPDCRTFCCLFIYPGRYGKSSFFVLSGLFIGNFLIIDGNGGAVGERCSRGVNGVDNNGTLDPLNGEGEMISPEKPSGIFLTNCGLLLLIGEGFWVFKVAAGDFGVNN